MIKNDEGRRNDPGVTVEVTPEMIEAGIDVYLQWCPDSGTGDRTDQKMVREVYDAMVRVALSPSVRST